MKSWRRCKLTNVATLTEMTDKLIHGYFGVDLGAAWNTVEDDIPLVKDESDIRPTDRQPHHNTQGSSSE